MPPRKRIPVAEYVNRLQERQNVASEIKNVTSGRPFWKEGAWHVQVQFSKKSELQRREQRAVLVSENRADYGLTVEFAYDPQEDRAGSSTSRAT